MGSAAGDDSATRGGGRVRPATRRPPGSASFELAAPSREKGVGLRLGRHGSSAGEKTDVVLPLARLDTGSGAWPGSAPGPASGVSSARVSGSPQPSQIGTNGADVAACLVLHYDRRTIWCLPAVAPLAHRCEDDPEIASLLGEVVVEAHGMLLVGALLEYPSFDRDARGDSSRCCARSPGARESRRSA